MIKSTEAALTYLQYLSDYFNGDWFLAIAAYNGGEGNVSRAVQSAVSGPAPPPQCSTPGIRNVRK